MLKLIEWNPFDEGLDWGVKRQGDWKKSVDLGLVDVFAALLELLNGPDGDVGEVCEFALTEIGLCAQPFEVAFRVRVSVQAIQFGVKLRDVHFMIGPVHLDYVVNRGKAVDFCKGEPAQPLVLRESPCGPIFWRFLIRTDGVCGTLVFFATKVENFVSEFDAAHSGEQTGFAIPECRGDAALKEVLPEILGGVGQFATGEVQHPPERLLRTWQVGLIVGVRHRV